MEYLKHVIALCGTEKSGGVSEGAITLAPFESALVKHLAKSVKLKPEDKLADDDIIELDQRCVEIKCKALVKLAKAAGGDFQFPQDLLPVDEDAA